MPQHAALEKALLWQTLTLMVTRYTFDGSNRQVRR